MWKRGRVRGRAPCAASPAVITAQGRRPGCQRCRAWWSARRTVLGAGLALAAAGPRGLRRAGRGRGARGRRPPAARRASTAGSATRWPLCGGSTPACRRGCWAARARSTTSACSSPGARGSRSAPPTSRSTAPSTAPVPATRCRRSPGCTTTRSTSSSPRSRRSAGSPTCAGAGLGRRTQLRRARHRAAPARHRRPHRRARLRRVDARARRLGVALERGEIDAFFWSGGVPTAGVDRSPRPARAPARPRRGDRAACAPATRSTTSPRSPPAPTGSPTR